MIDATHLELIWEGQTYQVYLDPMTHEFVLVPNQPNETEVPTSPQSTVVRHFQNVHLDVDLVLRMADWWRENSDPS